jgi:hypothetical protein
MSFTPSNQLESEPSARFISASRNSIVVRAADAVDVIGDSDLQQGLSALTTSLRHPHARSDDAQA